MVEHIKSEPGSCTFRTSACHPDSEHTSSRCLRVLLATLEFTQGHPGGCDVFLRPGNVSGAARLPRRAEGVKALQWTFQAETLPRQVLKKQGKEDLN